MHALHVQYFRRNKEEGTVLGYAHTSAFHTANSSFDIGKDLLEPLRRGSIQKEDFNLLVLKNGAYDDVHASRH